MLLIWIAAIGMGFESQSCTLQRIFIGSIFLWIFLVGLRLLR